MYSPVYTRACEVRQEWNCLLDVVGKSLIIRMSVIALVRKGFIGRASTEEVWQDYEVWGRYFENGVTYLT